MWTTADSAGRVPWTHARFGTAISELERSSKPWYETLTLAIEPKANNEYGLRLSTGTLSGVQYANEWNGLCLQIWRQALMIQEY